MSKLLLSTWVFNNSISKKLKLGKEIGRVEFIVDGDTIGSVDLDHKREFNLPDDSYRVQCVLRYVDDVGDLYVYYSDIYDIELIEDEEFVFVLYYLPYDGSNKGFDCGLRGDVPLRPQAHKESEGSSAGLCFVSFLCPPIGFIYWLVKRKKKPHKAKKALIAALVPLAMATMTAIIGLLA